MFTLNKIKKVINSKGWDYFKTGYYNLNIVGIRANEQLTNTFNDYITVFYNDVNNIERFHIFPATTDPGTYWIENPMNVNGCAVVKPGRYPSLWKLGIHYTYEAFVQDNNITVWRDSNKNNVIDTNVEETGMFGINLHRAHEIYPGSTVDKWSAGCQVIADPLDFQRLLSLGKLQVQYKMGETFTYILLEEKDFQ